jgi:hypothetical protein
MEQLTGKEARKKRLNERNEAIIKRYEELSEKKVKNVKLYSTEAKIQMVADEYFLSTRTIEEIIFWKKDK